MIFKWKKWIWETKYEKGWKNLLSDFRCPIFHVFPNLFPPPPFGWVIVLKSFKMSSWTQIFNLIYLNSRPLFPSIKRFFHNFSKKKKKGKRQICQKKCCLLFWVLPKIRENMEKFWNWQKIKNLSGVFKHRSV